MAERPRFPWPRFDLVTVTGESLPPRLAAAYPALSVPRGGIGACTPTVELTLLPPPDGQELICFGELSYGVMCLNPADGQVVDMVIDSAARIVRPLRMVNSGHREFVATVCAATARFPFHGDDPDTDLLAVADGLRAQLEPIDPLAWYPGGYWDTSYWDVSNGDYGPGDFWPPGIA